MGFFDRLANVWKGFLSLWVSDIESRNPEAVYEAAIDERVRKHRDLKKAVSGIVYLRNKLSNELEPSLLTGFLSASAVVNAHRRPLPD